MNAIDLKKKQDELRVAIDAHAQKLGYDNNVIKPIRDGVCDFEGYLSSNPKVMWILKEPNGQISDEEIEGGGWSIVEDSFRNDLKGVSKQPTWQKIIYVMYGYLNSCKYDDMDYVASNTEMAKVIQNIAYLNIGKMPGRNRTTTNIIEQYYQQWKPILYRQIETYAPDVIIFGNTFEHFRTDLIKDELKQIDGSPGWVEVFECKGRFLLSAYHPLQRWGDKEYINTLIDTLNKLFPNIK